jgi:hypothetical protein
MYYSGIGLTQRTSIMITGLRAENAARDFQNIRWAIHWTATSVGWSCTISSECHISQIQKLRIRPVSLSPCLLYSALKQADERIEIAPFIADQSMETLWRRKPVPALTSCYSCSAEISHTKHCISVLLRVSVLSNSHSAFKHTSVVLQHWTDGSVKISYLGFQSWRCMFLLLMSNITGNSK